jgi:hypothetical protein
MLRRLLDLVVWAIVVLIAAAAIHLALAIGRYGNGPA